MALVNGNDYDHIDLQAAAGGDVTRHMLKDAKAREDVSALESALSEKDELINFTDSLINYGYDTPANLAAGSSGANRIGVKRNGPIVTLNGNSTYSAPAGGPRIRLNGSVDRRAGDFYTYWGGGISFVGGHLYKASLRLLSGEGSILPTIAFYPADTTAAEAPPTEGTRLNVGENAVDWIFTPRESTAYNIALYITKNNTFTNATYLVILQDLTEEDLHSGRVPFDHAVELTSERKVTACTNIGASYNAPITADMFEGGGFTSGDGLYASTKRQRLKNTIAAKKGSVLRFVLPDDILIMVWELSTPERAANTSMRTINWCNSTQYVAQNDCYIMLALRNKSDTAITQTDIDGIVVESGGNNTIDLMAWDADRKLTVDYFEVGAFSGADGINAEYQTKRLRLISPIYCTKGTELKASIGELYWLIWELTSSSREGGNVITAEAWSTNESYTVKNDCWIMIAIATASTVADSADIYNSDFEGCYIQVVQAGRSAKPQEIAEDYLMLKDAEITGKLKDYAGRMVGKTSIESFMFFTDSHWLNDPEWEYAFTNAMSVLGGVYHSAPVDFCIYGGDAISGTNPYNQMTKEMAMYYLTLQDQVSRATFGDPYYPLIGNHDYNYQAADNLTEQDLVNAWFRRWGRAYYSFKGTSASFYCLNTGLNRTSGGSGSYDVTMDDYKWAQIDWLANALLNDDPAHAVIALHIVRNNNSGQPEFVLFTQANELCAAYNARTSITKNGITYNFTNCTGKVEFFLAGHLHSDAVYGIKNGIPYITRTTAKSAISPTFDLVLCDWTNGTAFFKRFGTGEDTLFDLSTGEPVT